MHSEELWDLALERLDGVPANATMAALNPDECYTVETFVQVILAAEAYGVSRARLAGVRDAATRRVNQQLQRQPQTHTPAG
ncbi:MAG: hypothetical protein NVS1B14_03770 [Vulcanimicrobiaceae bacterium]